ncbi:hypothetical protein SDC9_149105 [bioreactor metagenome]|uniref:Uncharacterized protein n=1 Tax=bioreactor metagenome TaxID=1076179 RepID=A0A645EKV6_9ZZZZ
MGDLRQTAIEDRVFPRIFHRNAVSNHIADVVAKHPGERRGVLRHNNFQFQPVLIGKALYHLVMVSHLLVTVNKIGRGRVERDDPKRIFRHNLRKIIGSFLRSFTG